ncbi:MAG: fibronectin type III domain-containing protein [Desulfurellaceae bacterium]|nr:fibronectin type III domain-containing protein [Desulfurellaceae bacterium]
MRLTWDDPDDPTITGYEFRARITDVEPEEWRPDWTAIPNSDATTTTATVYQLGNGVNFTFGIRAVRGDDKSVKGAGVHVTATPRAPRPPPPPPPGTGRSGSSRDRHGNTPARATPVSLGETAPWTASITGRINTTRDSDYFRLGVPHDGVLVVETTGSTDTVGTVWQDGQELTMADSGGAGRNFRLSTSVEAGTVVIAVEGNGNRTGAYTSRISLLVSFLENPGPESFQSDLGVISGWVCDAQQIDILFDPGTEAEVRFQAAYGTSRADTADTCGDMANGFGLLFNWNLLGAGERTVALLADGIELGRATVTVTALGQGAAEEFLEGVAGECVVEDFPAVGETARLVWQQANQNFVIAGENAPVGENTAGADALEGHLENPGPGAFQSGLGVISGWVCEAQRIDIVFDPGTEAEVSFQAAYGTDRADTADTCGDTNNGFGLLFNWNLLGAGEHAVVAVADGVELGRAAVIVTTVGEGEAEEFLEGVVGECVVEDFPAAGKSVRLVWQQRLQNFMIAPPGP